MNLEEQLRASKPKSQEPPPFLHARIMNSLQAPEVAKRPGVRRLCAALVMASIAIGAALIFNRPSDHQQVAIEVPTIPVVSLPPNASLQSEMENLKADARNAARALASNFLPSEP